MLEILNRGAFAQKLRVRYNGEFPAWASRVYYAFDLVAGADRHGGLGDDDGGPSQGVGDLARRLIDVT